MTTTDCPKGCLPIEALKPWLQPRTPDQEARSVAYLTALFRDLREPQKVPILLANDGTKRIIDGHCRWKALQAAKVKFVAVAYWKPEHEPTLADAQQINANQSTLEPESATASLDQWDAMIATGKWTAESIAQALNRSPDKIRRQVKAWKALDDTEKTKARESKAGIGAIEKAALIKRAMKPRGNNKPKLAQDTLEQFRPLGPKLETGKDESPIHAPAGQRDDARAIECANLRKELDEARATVKALRKELAELTKANGKLRRKVAALQEPAETFEPANDGEE